jgi:hypothetical protein
VIMGSKEEAEAIVNMSHELDGRRIEAKFALPKGETPGGEPSPGGGVGGGGRGGGGGQSAGGGGAPMGGTRIFVARVPPEVSDEAFRKYFEVYGDIQDSYMPKVRGVVPPSRETQRPVEGNKHACDRGCGTAEPRRRLHTVRSSDGRSRASAIAMDPRGRR